MEYRDYFEGILSHLRESDFVELIKSRINRPVSEWIIRSFEEEGIRISDDLLAFYTNMNGCDIEWECNLDLFPKIKKNNAEDSVVRGKIQINSMSNLFTYNRKIFNFFKEEFCEDEIDDLKSFRVFDNNDPYTRIGFLVENKVIDSKLHFILEDADGFSSAPFTFQEYIERMRYYLGFQAWEYHALFYDEEYERYVNHYKQQIFT